jgi:hypothetical protein
MKNIIMIPVKKQQKSPMSYHDLQNKQYENNMSLQLNDIQHLCFLDRGKQGIVGKCLINNIEYVYKISQYMNYLPDHEYLIMKGLNDILSICPHFCKVFTKCKLPINPKFRDNDKNPFELDEGSSKSIMIDVLFMEYIPKSISLLKLIKHGNFLHIINVIKQVLIAVVISQKFKHFAHYDLHSLNILLKSCDKDEVNLYIIDDDNAFCIPTYGNNPIIIDHGFGYSKDLENNPSYISLAYTDSGYVSPAYDSLADPKIFLVSVSDDFKELRNKSKYTKKFRNIVKNLFNKLDIDWQSGWDKPREGPIIDQVFEYIENVDEKSLLFREYPHYCMDMLQSLITLPISLKIEGSYKELRKSYKVLVNEFYKIETEVHNLFYSLYIFRNIIDLARLLKPKYDNTETREEAIIYFRRELGNIINSVVKFCLLKGVDFEKILCSLYVFQEQLEFQLYHLLNKTLKRKYKDYNRLDIQCIEHIYGLIDINFKDKYEYNINTKINIYDTRFYGTDKFIENPQILELNEDMIENLNDMNYLSRGLYLMSFLTDDPESANENIID